GPVLPVAGMSVTAGVRVFDSEARLPAHVRRIAERGGVGVRLRLVGREMAALTHGLRGVVEAQLRALHAGAERPVPEIAGDAGLRREGVVPELPEEGVRVEGVVG